MNPNTPTHVFRMLRKVVSAIACPARANCTSSVAYLRKRRNCHASGCNHVCYNYPASLASTRPGQGSHGGCRGSRQMLVSDAKRPQPRSPHHGPALPSRRARKPKPHQVQGTVLIRDAACEACQANDMPMLVPAAAQWCHVTSLAAGVTPPFQ